VNRESKDLTYALTVTEKIEPNISYFIIFGILLKYLQTFNVVVVPFSNPCIKLRLFRPFQLMQEKVKITCVSARKFNVATSVRKNQLELGQNLYGLFVLNVDFLVIQTGD